MIAGMPPGTGVHSDGAILDGVLERITFANPETGYTIARIDPGRGGPDMITAVGPLLGAQVGESLRMRGRWTSHPKYGKQFEVHSYTTVLPATAAGIQRYLGSGLIKGIGPVMAERMVNRFGVDIMHIIEDSPGRLIEVEGLGPKRTAMITAAWAEQKAIKEVMIFLQGVGVSTSLAVRIYKKYGDASISVVRAEPYRLASDVWGIGFKTADTIAAAVGIARDSPERIKAGLAYTLSEAADDGHCYLPAPNLIADAAKILDVPAELITPCLDELAAAEGVVREAVPASAGTDPQVPAVYLPPFYQAERSLASSLLRLLAAREDRLAAFTSVDWDKVLGWLRGRTGSSLAPEQEEAVRLALTSRIAVLTGGPGCGKSFTVRSVVELARAKGARIILAAPTGRAAKRLAELTGHEAATIHRLLQLRPGGEPSFDAATPLDADLVVVDETSMVDVILANKLVKAVPPGAHLLLVGDVDQLPSVGAGEVLRDLLSAGSLPVVRLRRIFRQAQQSGIVINAHRINDGQPPGLTGFADFFWFSCEEAEQTAELVVDIVARRIPARFGLDPRRDVQVLCPMHRGPTGAGNLNTLLQEALTPFREGQQERRYGGRVFRIGDKVTQLRNNYEKGAAGVFNGTVGVVTGMSLDDHTLTVLTDEDEKVDYGFDELDELAHAYAVTIHRSQGSEYPAVVIPLTMGSWMMLQRNLLYTGVTRARKLVVLAGSRRALAVAVRTRGAGRRHTSLGYRLRLHRAQPEQQAGRRDGRGTGHEQRDASCGRGDRLQDPGPVDAADGPEQLPLGHRLARTDGRLPPALVLTAQPQEAAKMSRRPVRAGARGRVVGHAERREDPVEPADVRVDGGPFDEAAAAGFGDDGRDAGGGRSRAGGAADRTVRTRFLADDVAEPVRGGQLAGPGLGRARVVERERLKRLDHVAGVHVDQRIGARDELRECRVRQPVGESPRRVAREAPVEVLAVVGHDERAAGAERGQVQHRHRDNPAAQFPFLEAPGPLADAGSRRVLRAVHSGQDGEPRAVAGAGQLDDGYLQAGQRERVTARGRGHASVLHG